MRNSNGLAKGISAILLAGVLAAGVCCTGFASRDDNGKWFGNGNIATWHWSDKTDGKADDNTPDDEDNPVKPCVHEYAEGSHTCTVCGEVSAHEYAENGHTCTICGERAVTYTVTYELNGGEGRESEEVRVGTAVSVADDPTREGYDFTGWYTDVALENAYETKNAVTGALTLYAGWAQKMCTVTCLYDGLERPLLTRSFFYGEKLQFLESVLFAAQYQCKMLVFMYTREEVAAGTTVEGTDLGNGILDKYVEEKDGKTYLYSFVGENHEIKTDMTLYPVVRQMSWDSGYHKYENGVCIYCGIECEHSYLNGQTECKYCGEVKPTE